MFHRFPYWGWLLAALLCWAFTGYRHYLHSEWIRPAAMAEKIADDLAGREAGLQRLLQKKELILGLFDGTLSAREVNRLSEEPFYLYGFEGERDLVFWNSNRVIGTCHPDSVQQENGSLVLENGVYLKRCIRLPYMRSDQRIVALFPVSVQYPIRNEYLTSFFPAATYIPRGTEITIERTAESLPVNNSEGHPLFYARFGDTSFSGWIPDGWLVAGLFMAIALSVAWINIVASALARKKKPVYGILLIVMVAVTTLWLLCGGKLPFHLDELPLFSSLLYASSAAFPSLGMLLIYLLFALWLILFTTFHISNNRLSIKGTGQRYVVVLLIACLLTACTLSGITLIRSLVMDSSISFDVSNIYSADIYTAIGLIIVGLVMCVMILTIYFFHGLMNTLVGLPWKKYPWLLLSAVMFSVVAGDIASWHYLTFLWMILLLVLLDCRILRQPPGLLSAEIVGWLLFIALSSGTALSFFTPEKEQQKERIFAETIVRQRDDMLEYLFGDISHTISGSRFLQHYLNHPRQDQRVLVNERFSTRHLKGQLIKYQADIHFFDKNDKPVFNKDTQSLQFFRNRILQAQPTHNPWLFYRENAQDGYYYIAAIPVVHEDSIFAGTIVLNLKLKTAINEAVYPELLHPGSIIEAHRRKQYSYGIYSERRLITQTDDYPFPMYIDVDSLSVGAVTIQYASDFPVAYYKTDDHTVVSVVNRHNHWLETLTLFSYMLVTCILFSFVTFLVQRFFHIAFRKKGISLFTRFTLRKRIMLAIPGVVLVSFIVIAAVTVWILVQRYEDSGKEKLRSAIQTAERSLQQYIRDQNLSQDAGAFYAEAQHSRFRHFIVTLANTQRIDLNVYNIYGTLMASSQDDIYDKGLLARIMMPQAYYKLSEEGGPLLIEKEQIGRLRYESGYVPLKSETGTIMGYLNVPFFSSQNELSYQISSILVALINLYAFIFFLSGLVAVLISNMLTRGLQIIISRFQQFKLTGNEPVLWPYEDEIGLLVKEYNKMVDKVAVHATLLAQHERETAWREMARQVAHEIKNPLTPMKLNIQYLQHALRSGHPDTETLTANVSASLIEQIDNLAYIASAFSDFARMPEAKPEYIALPEMLQTVSGLYNNQKGLEVQLLLQTDTAVIYADRSQLLRVLTNLLQNAVEAIPDDIEGRIEIGLENQGDMWLLQIRDNGSGIPASLQARIFSPYFTTKGSGTGLGLAMSKKIIEFWKGKIWFETTEGQGTVFFLLLPVADVSVSER